ncbi:Flavin-containing monooxygenase [Penicillium ucsense]|uniref:Flavin-containing monooxygenase n=1 Tax=Penicillium ucsense TaxID=2839758 RepID=A0A8J8W364_9EURO|nr:Flavin-containing monooxygenase [Penicillium ucsense]KAF7738217.1 Flavin-containing monooxygenase [Penicillium ucsense]
MSIEPRAVDESRPLRVVVIGAGISGILACIRLNQRVPNLDLCIYDKNADIGGTWFENQYPGCACDIPAHTYQATFEPNKKWSSFYASSTEIHQYWKGIVEKYGCMRYIRLRHQVKEATWVEEESKWHVKVQDTATGCMCDDKANVIIQATGALNNWRWPNVPGLHDFGGKLLHSVSWDVDYDYSNQRVAVIGNGSSGIQIVPGMLPRVAHIDHYVRSRTWIAPSFAREYLEQRGSELDNYTFTAEEIKSFETDHQKYQDFRKKVEYELQSVHGMTLIGHPQQLSVKKLFVENMTRRLGKSHKLMDDLMPSFAPACKRLTPGPGYLEALADDKVTLIKSEITKIDRSGIVTADGEHREVDAIVCATGFDTTHTPRFPITGRAGMTLAARWKQTPETYLSVAVNGFPNYFISLRPNSGLGDGNLLILIERQIDYFTQCIRKIQRDNIRALSVKANAVQLFTQYCDSYFAGTVFADNCRSWYKGGTEDGRVIALWPGSSLHAMEVFASPRWEDFDIEYVNNNPMSWLGDGWTQNKKLDQINVDYLDDDRVDFPQPVEIMHSVNIQ